MAQVLEKHTLSNVMLLKRRISRSVYFLESLQSGVIFLNPNFLVSIDLWKRFFPISTWTSEGRFVNCTGGGPLVKLSSLKVIYWKQTNINQEEAKSLWSFCNFLELYFCLFKAYHFKFWQWYWQIVPDRYSSNVEKTEEGSVTCKNLCNTLTCSRSYTVYLIYPSLRFMSMYMNYQHAKIQQSKVFFAHSAGTL